ncbi:MAG: DUF4145 domain-containing protein [Terriglobales bacterium]|jgi:hypothetical protein
MATRQRTSTLIRNAVAVEADGLNPTADLLAGLNTLRNFAKTAAKHGFKLGAHTHYSVKAHETLVEIRRKFLELRANYQHDQHPAVAAQLDALEGPLKQLEQGLELNATKLKDIIRDVVFKVGSDLRAAIEAEANHGVGTVPFITPEILKPGVYRKVLEEANRCFAENCPNACAAMLRRLVESLIIEAFEAHKIEARIKDSTGEYLELKALIGKATADADLKLSRNTKSALPNLKFLGDLSVHSRRNLIRGDDLKGIRNDARGAIEELASHFTL